MTDYQQGESCSARLPELTAAKPAQVWKPGHETPQFLSAVEKDYNYSIFSTTFPEKSVICSPSVCFLLLVSCFVSFFLCLLGQEAAGAAPGDAKSTHDPQVGAFLVHTAEERDEEGFKLDSMAENLCDAVILSSCSDRAETRKQL